MDEFSGSGSGNCGFELRSSQNVEWRWHLPGHLAPGTFLGTWHLAASWVPGTWHLPGLLVGASYPHGVEPVKNFIERKPLMRQGAWGPKFRGTRRSGPQKVEKPLPAGARGGEAPGGCHAIESKQGEKWINHVLKRKVSTYELVRAQCFNETNCINGARNRLYEMLKINKAHSSIKLE